MNTTQEMAMNIAKKLLTDHMRNNRARFQSPWADEEGRYFIIESHKTDDAPPEFPHECLYYREVGDGWAISVGW